MNRPVEELENTRDCVEEILFVTTNRVNLILLRLDDDEPGVHPADKLYSDIEAIVLRAQALGAASCSRRRNGSPLRWFSRPPGRRRPR